MKSFSTHITEAKGGFKDFQDPWAMMNPEDRREAGRLQIAALKAFPGSPRQKDIRAKLNAILKKYRIGEGIEESASDERWMRSVDSFLASVKLGEPYPKHDVVKGKDVHFIVIDTGSVGDSSKGGAWRQSHEWHGFVADSDSPLAKITHFQSTWNATASRGNWGNPQLEMGRRQLMRDVWDRLAGKKVLWRKTMRIG